jgi:N-acetylmuramoyl-L-alanine amidase
VPAVLGEPAMISNPVIEGRLTLARSLELEASAYFLGLRDYFAAGTPRWVTDLPDTLTPLDVAARWHFDPGSPEAPTLDPASLVVAVDGRPVPYVLLPDGQTVEVELPARHGGRRLEIRGRNLAGRAAFPRVHGFATLRLGDWSTLFIAEAGPPPRRGLLSYAHSTTPLRDFGLLLLAPRDRPAAGIPLPAPSGRRGWLVLDPAPVDLADRVISGRVAGGDTLAWSDEPPQLAGLPPGVLWVTLAAPPSVWSATPVPGGGWRSRIPRDSGLVGAGDNDWPAVAWSTDQPLWLEADGAVPIVLPPWNDAPAGATPSPARPDTLVWQPILPALIGKRVAIDPRGGGTDDQGAGPLGSRGSELNLHVAERLAALLRGAGCEVVLLRRGEVFLPDPERVLRADRFGAELYLAVGRGEPEIRHHHGSSVGEPWAAACAEAVTPLLADTVAVTAAYDYVLRHTACPAILVRLEEPATTEIESRLTDPAWQDAMARALFRGTVALLQPEAPFARVPELLDPLGARAIGRDRLDLVRLDGNLSWLPPSGQVTGVPLPSWSITDPGLPVLGDRHVLELRDGPHWQLWALEREPEGPWHGRVLLENR